MAKVEIPRALGRFTVSPGIAIGYGWMTFAQQHMDGHMLPMSIDPTVKLVIYTAAGLAAGILLGWLMFGRKSRAPIP